MSMKENEILILCESFTDLQGDEMKNVCGVFTNTRDAHKAFNEQMEEDLALTEEDTKYEHEYKEKDENGMPSVNHYDIHGNGFSLWFVKTELNKFYVNEPVAYIGFNPNL